MPDGTELQIKDRMDRHRLCSLYAKINNSWQQKAQVRVDFFGTYAEAVATLKIIGQALVSGELKLLKDDIAVFKKNILETAPTYNTSGQKEAAPTSGIEPPPKVTASKRPAAAAENPQAMKRPAAARGVQTQAANVAEVNDVPLISVAASPDSADDPPSPSILERIEGQ
jgi:hypothetical protein